MPKYPAEGGLLKELMEKWDPAPKGGKWFVYPDGSGFKPFP